MEASGVSGVGWHWAQGYVRTRPSLLWGLSQAPQGGDRSLPAPTLTKGNLQEAHQKECVDELADALYTTVLLVHSWLLEQAVEDKACSIIPHLMPAVSEEASGSGCTRPNISRWPTWCRASAAPPDCTTLEFLASSWWKQSLPLMGAHACFHHNLGQPLLH